MRPAIAATVVAALVTISSPSLAVRPEVQAAIELFEQVRFGEAREAFERASSLEGSRAEDVAVIHFHLGIIYGAGDQEERAERHFRIALAVDPLLELPSGHPPKITRPFASARAFWRGARLRIGHERPTGWVVGRPADLEVEAVDDLLSLVQGARLHVGRVGDEEPRTFQQGGSGPFVFPVPEELLEEEGDVRYRFELVGPASSVLLALDEEDLRVHVEPGPAEPLEGGGGRHPAVFGPIGDEQAPRTDTALWVGLSAVAAVVVAAAVTLGVVFGTRPDQAAVGPLEVRWP